MSAKRTSRKRPPASRSRRPAGDPIELLIDSLFDVAIGATKTYVRRFAQSRGFVMECEFEIPPPRAAMCPERAKAMKILGVSDPLTLEGLKERRRALAKIWHPDRHTDKNVATKKCAAINAAYDLLAKEIQR